MILLLCSDCGFLARVHVEDDNDARMVGEGTAWHPNSYPCPRCSGYCRVTDGQGILAAPIDLTPQEAFAAFSGVGLPDEQECSAHTVRSLIRQHGVKDVTTYPVVGTKRCLLERIQLNNGWELYLGASTHGPCVYKIKKGGPHAGKADTDV